MRVTQTMLTRNALYRLAQRKQNMDDIQNRISSGKRVQRASDDPGDFSKAQRLENRLKQNEQYLKNIELSEGWIDNTVSLMQSLSDIVIQAKDIANRGSDGQADADIRSTLADQAESLLKEAVAIGNSKYLDKNVFGGTKTKVDAPFVLGGVNGTTVSYLGNDVRMSRKYSETVSVEINTTGQEIVDSGIFSALDDLITALRADDQTGINATIDDLKTAQDTLLSATADIGARSANLRLIRSRLEQNNVDLEKFVSNARDARLDYEIVNFQNEQLSYQAALQVTSKTINLNIMQFLG